METRIRHFRKQNGWTLQHLAELVGTTAQTVQRLETANMTVSVDWLQRFADVFEVHPADLIAAPSPRDVPFLGVMGRGGLLRVAPAQQPENGALTIDIPAENPIAVKLDEPIWGLASGTVLIGNRSRGTNMSNAIGANALVGLQNGAVVLARVIRGTGDTFTLVPPRPGDDVRYDQTPDWVARIVMTVNYM